MAIWNERPHTNIVLEAAERWKQDCLLHDRSLFSQRSLWTAENIAALCEAFLDNPILGSDRFIDKLEQQLSATPATVQQLGAEALWLLYLFVSDNQMGPGVKRDRIALCAASA